MLQVEHSRQRQKRLLQVLQRRNLDAAVIVVATRYGRGPSLLSSVLSVAAFDFFFVPPYLTFAVSDTQYLVTFAVMLLVALVISSLAARIRAQAESARDRERRIAALYAMSRELASTRGVRQLLRVAVRHIVEVFRAQVVVLLPDADGRLAPGDPSATEPPLDSSEAAVGQWVFEHGQVAGQGTDTLPGAAGIYVPLLGSRGTVGVLGLRSGDLRALHAPERDDVGPLLLEMPGVGEDDVRELIEPGHVPVRV